MTAVLGVGPTTWKQARLGSFVDHKILSYTVAQRSRVMGLTHSRSALCRCLDKSSKCEKLFDCEEHIRKKRPTQFSLEKILGNFNPKKKPQNLKTTIYLFQLLYISLHLIRLWSLNKLFPFDWSVFTCTVFLNYELGFLFNLIQMQHEGSNAEQDLERQGSNNQEVSGVEDNPTLPTIVISDGDSHHQPSNDELPHVLSPKKGYFSRTGSSHEQCRYPFL